MATLPTPGVAVAERHHPPTTSDLPPLQGSGGVPRARAWLGRRRPLAWPAAALAAAVLIGLTRVAATLGQPFSNFGDVAVTELQVMAALHGHALLGPYSRFGWSHPGPAYFYFLVPFYVLGGHGTRSLFLGALAVNVGAAVATVAVVRRRAGPAAGWCAAAVLAVFLLVAGPQLLMNPWNPSVLALPVLLTVVLAAAGAAGSLPCLAWAAVTGTFAVQTHISTLPEVVLALVLGIAGLALGRALAARRRHGASSRDPVAPMETGMACRRGAVLPCRRGAVLPCRRGAVLPCRRGAGVARWRGTGVARWRGAVLAGAGLALAVGLWVPPLVQQATHHPGNLAKIVAFFTAAHHGAAANSHPLAPSLATIVNQVTVVPAGKMAGLVVTQASGWRRALALVDLVDALVVVQAALLMRRRLPLALGAFSALGLLLGVYSTTRIVGPIDPYLVEWMAMVPVPAWLGTGILVCEWWGRRRPFTTGRAPALEPPGASGSGASASSGASAGWGAGARSGAGSGRYTVAGRALMAALVLVALAPVAVLGLRFAQGPTYSFTNFPETQQVAAVVDADLGRLGTHRVLVRFATVDRWPIGAGLIVDLVRQGVQVSVPKPWLATFGTSFRATGQETAVIVLDDPYLLGAPAPPPDATTVVGDYGTTSVWARPLVPSA